MESSIYKAVRSACLAGSAAALMLASAGSYAAASDVSDTGTELQEVIVTGSHLARTDTETPSPIQVVTAKDLEESGYTTVTQVLQNLTANGQGTLSNAFPGAFAGGATGISLRGLNTSATLVMIDGHRMAPYPLSDDGQRSFVDVTSIPFESVERIEVLKDGASAVYGSDAMAGVVNIILKKSYVGTSISAEGGTTTEGGGATAHASIIHGMGDLDSDGYNAYVTAEYRHQGDILQTERNGRGLWSSTDLTSIGGINQTPGTVGPHTPVPPSYGTVYLTPLTGNYSAANSFFYNTALKPNSAYNGACTFATQAAGGCAYENPYGQIQPETDNLNFLGSLTKKLGDDWSLNAKASFFDSRGQQYPTYPTIADGLNPYPTSFSPLVAVSGNSPIPRLVGTTIPAVTVPATYPGNPFGAPAQVNGVIPGAPVLHTDYNAKSYRFVFDVTGKAVGWDISTSAGYTRVATTQWQYGDPNVPVLNAALNNTTNPFLITGGNSAAMMASIFPKDSVTDTSELEFGEFNASRSLFNLPGGPFGFAVGAQVINRKLDAPAPPLDANGILGGSDAFAEGSQSDSAVYAEVDAPIVKMFELDGHVRYDHFNNSGGDATPSLGFKFKPIEQFLLRGSWGRGFRAPNPAENGRGGQTFIDGAASDPVLCANGNPGTAGNVPSACNFPVIQLNSANPNLKPEKSYSETLGIVVQPITNWSSTFDFYKVKISNQIVSGSLPPLSDGVRGAPVTTNCSNGAGGVVPCTPAVGPILYVPVSYINANSTAVSGLELTSHYDLHLGGFGTITTEIDWSHQLKYLLTEGGVTSELAGTHGPFVIGGDTGNPKDRVQGSVSWASGPLNVRATVNWISAFSLTDPSFGFDSCSISATNVPIPFPFFPGTANQPTNSSYCKVGDFIDTDLYASYKLPLGLMVHGAITNVFNRQPPLDIGTYGGGNLPYNPSMAQVGAVGRFVDIGVVWTF
jgi:iron complex outermembrane receptor protein